MEINKDADSRTLNDAKTTTDDDPYTKAVSEWDAIQAIPIFHVGSATTEETSVSETTTKLEDERHLRSSSQERKPETTVPLNHGRHDIPSLTFSSTSSMTLELINQFIQEVELTSEFPRIQRHASKRSKVVVFMKRALFLSPKTIRHSLRTERDRVLALALKQFDNKEPIHIKMLTSLYQQLMGNSLSSSSSSQSIPCPRIGSHWESIGFQGIDPVSDLRGVGLLGLYQLCFLALSSLTSQLALDIFSTSTGGSKDCLGDHVSPAADSTFPFAVTGLNLTQMSLYCLRKGILNKEINRRGHPVILTFNLFYSSLFLKFSRIWQSRPNASISDAGFILKDIRSQVRRGVRGNILQVLSYGENKSLTEGFLEGLKSNNNLEQIVHNRTVEATESSIIFSDIGNIVETSAVTNLNDEDIQENEDLDVQVFSCLERVAL